MNEVNQLKIAAFFRAHALHIVGITFLLVLAWRLSKHFDMNWDTLSYHLPFISYRAGFENNTSFVMLDIFQHRFLGFPPLVDYFQAAFWKLTGNISTITLINPLAITCLALYLAYTYRLSIFWTILIFIAIPTLHVNVDSAYTDLWTNSFFTLFLISTFETIRTKDRSLYIHTTMSLLSLAIAVNSKPQFTVIGGIAFVLLMGTLITKRIQCANPHDTRRFSIIITIFVIAAPIAFYTPIRNTVIFHNPVYPVSVSKFGLTLNGTEDVEYGIFGPADLRNRPGWEKYLLSQLEFRGLSGRPGAYTLSQGDVPAGSESDRMGGSLLPLLVVAICSLCTGLYQVFKSTRNWKTYPLIDLGVLSAIVAVFPGSYDLRYFSFIEITLVAAALLVLQDLTRSRIQFSSGLLLGLKCTLIGSALFVSSITGFRHIYPPQFSARAAVASVAADAGFARALLKSKKLCYVGPLYGFLYSHVMHPEIAVDYSLTVVDAPAGCPEGSALIN